MKWKYIDRMVNWTHEKYHTGRKHGATAQVMFGKGKYYFYVERKKDDYNFNSLWGTHPDVDQ